MSWRVGSAHIWPTRNFWRGVPYAVVSKTDTGLLELYSTNARHEQANETMTPETDCVAVAGDGRRELSLVGA